MSRKRDIGDEERSDYLPSNRHLVVYVLYLLGGDVGRIHTEEIAKKCHDFFPDSFSWTLYPDLPDKDIVRVTLFDSQKKKYGGLVEGRSGRSSRKTAKGERLHGDGWILTEQGIEWVEQNRDQLEAYSGHGKPKAHRQQLLRDLRPIFKHQLWKSFEEQSESFSPSIGEVADLLRCRVDSASTIWNSRLDGLQRQAILIQRDDLAAFVDICRRVVHQGA